MTKNTLLNIGIIICKFLRLLQVVILVILTGVFVHLQISPSNYKNVDIDFKNSTRGISFKTTSSYKTHVDGQVPEDLDVFTVNKLKTSSLFFNYIKLSLLLVMSFLCLKEFQKVIESVKEIKTFQKRNVSSFRKIGKYLLIIFILVSYSSFTFQQGGTSGFHISLEFPILALLSYIMAEIFMEGNKLSEENKLTV